MAKKTKQKKTSKALVVYSQPELRQPKQNKKKKTSKGMNNEAIVQYRNALQNPFSPAANGARVPDMYCVPTSTRHITKVISLKTNASGEFDLIVMPSAYMHALSPRSCIMGGVAWQLLDGTNVPDAVLKTFPPNLFDQLTNYRIVGYGVKVMGTQSLTATSGRITAATVPISSWVNERVATLGGQISNFAAPNANMTNTLGSWGIPNAGNIIDLAALPSLPNSVEVTTVRLTEKPLHITPKISSPEAFNFRESKDTPTGFGMQNQTSGSYVVGGDPSYLRLGGFEAVVITGSGLTANASGVVDVEVIYHLEGNPCLSATAIIGSDDKAASLVNPIAWMSTIQAVAKLPAFRDLVEVGGNALLPGFGSLATRYM